MERERSKEWSAFFSLFSSRRRAWSVLKCNQGSEVFQVHFALYGQDNYVFEREFMYFKMFHRRFINFSVRRLREKLQNVSRFEMDFVLNFVLSRFHLRERIHDPDSVPELL